MFRPSKRIHTKNIRVPQVLHEDTLKILSQSVKLFGRYFHHTLAQTDHFIKILFWT